MVLALNFEDSRLKEICLRRGVSRLEIFGSATRSDFDASRSDLDFLVEFDSRAAQTAFDNYFGLKEDLALLFGRPVDLVMPGAIRKPYVRAEIERDRALLYAT